MEASLQAWSPRDHGGGALNFGVVEAPSGFIYVANAAGILEFDGVRWQTIPLPGGGAARLVATDAAGTIWAARTGEVVQLLPSGTGLEARSVVERLLPADRDFGPVLQAFPTAAGIGFVTRQRVLVATGERIDVLRADEDLACGWWMDGAVHVGTAGGRWLRAEAAGWREIAGAGDATGARHVLAATRRGPRTVLLTARGPLARDDAAPDFVPLAAQRPPFARRSAADAVATPTGYLVFLLGRGELVRYRADGTVLPRLPDLPGVSADCLGADRDGGLWVARPPDLLRLPGEEPPAPPVAQVRHLLDARARPLLATPAGYSLPTDARALQAVFAAPGAAPGRLEFRTQLTGADAAWSEWSGAAQRVWNTPPAGTLLLRVQARRAPGAEGPVAESLVRVAAPWWSRAWAVAGFVVFAIGGMGGIALIRTHALRRRARALEAEVAERTRTLRAQHDELVRLRALELDALATARLAEESARLQMLRYQLNPHFLYNALNSLYALVRSDAAGAADMIVRLSAFCRATLTRTELSAQTVGDEIELLRTYLAIEQARWQDELAVAFEIEPDVLPLPLPPFLLLPLVENAVKYGGRTSAAVLSIRIGAALPAPHGPLVLTVANTGRWVPPGSASPAESTGLGLDNIRQRLTRHHPGRHTLEHEERDGWVVCTLRLENSPSP